MNGIEALKHYPDPSPAKDRLLLAMLPGMGIKIEDFATQGLVKLAHAARQAVDVITVKPDQTLYLDGGVAQVLEQTILTPAREAGYRRVWLLGISLGGMGALSCAAKYGDNIEGLILLAPFFGTQGTVAELREAGGFAAWRPEASAATPPEREIISWLQTRLAGAPGPGLWLGHATRDRFATGHRLLAETLPPSKTVEVDGGHDWAAWRMAFQALMARAPFG
ncbi:MAG: alpha/beta fold hydrolase [Rhodospirillales bacterium]|nr:alpha/beta fold hydrolase [Rhodospirillales bacterium]MDE2318783.1 alpha/beta fold hydrolase [Rhodospirillales bacterium]